MKISDKVTVVKGIGKRMEEKLQRLGINTVEDLISFYPRKYQDWTRITPMDALEVDKEVVVYGKIIDIRETKLRSRLSLITIVISDGQGAINLNYFNQPWKKQSFEKSQWVLAYGKVEYQYTKYQISNAEVEMVSPREIKSFQKLVPVYPLTEGIRLVQMQKFIVNALENVSGLVEDLPEQVLIKYHLMGRKQAIKSMHFPKDWGLYRQARYRLAFEELFFMQVGIWLLRKKRESYGIGIKCEPSKELVRKIIRSLPFTLTQDQKKAFMDIENDMEALVPMHRLIQGDVGSGKTIVAALALAKIIENGYQGALMAPTEILAQQHFQTFSFLFKNSGIQIELLTGQTKAAEKKKILENVVNGDTDILLGTHALLQEQVVFSNLGLVVTDEQHRFGVKQRQRLETKGVSPHILVMTATPIPRTMALSVYGDLDVSSIRELPKGRESVSTYAIANDMLQRVYNFMKKEMQVGHQVYIVCPLVEESEKADLAAAVSVYEELKSHQFSSFRLGLVHGRMKSQDKECIMQDFVNGKIQLLVATSVIEVGINVPNATIMFVYGAERFGLSQLHQLRGRVGRGHSKSYCILYTNNNNDIVQFRMKLMTSIQDGFTLAEKDLLLRGSGEFFGTRQHGIPDFKVANVVKDLPILEKAREAARYSVEAGEDFRQELKNRYKTLFTEIYH